MSGNIFADDKMSSLLFGVGRTFRFKVKSTGKVFNMSILLEGVGNSHVPVGVRIF